MTEEFISRAEALRAVQKQRGANRSPAQNAMLDWICCDIKNMPAADVAPVVHGKWLEEDGAQIYSNCGEEHCWDEYRATFCDNCGARMDEAAK
jgi:hypothetical protein